MEYRKLNYVLLQDALYDAFAESEDKSKQKAEKGKEKLKAIFAEYKRRGFNEMVIPDIAK